MKVRPVYAASLMIVSVTAAAATLVPVDAYYYDPLAIIDNDDDMTSPTPMEQPADETPQAVAPATDIDVQAPLPASVPAASSAYTEPTVTVTITPQDRDTLINKDVMDALSNEPNLSGKIGVETYNKVVTLTGRVSTTGQVDRAGTLARGVSDVSEVQNLIHARVGG